MTFADETLLLSGNVETAPLLQGIIDWVEMETPPERPDMIDLLLDHAQKEFERLPVSIRRYPPKGGKGGQLAVTYAPEGASGKPVVMMGHIDTVWPVGTLAARPVRREGDKVFGPGIFDMKAGSYIITETLRRIASAGLVPPRPITVFLNGDEETGSHASRDVIEELASAAAFVLVPEPSFEAPGTVITKRKGIAMFKLMATGRSAHAGGSLAEGRSAAREIARHLLEIEALNETEPKASFNVGVIRGGTRSNMVPEYAEIEVDMRVEDMATATRMVDAILSRKAIGDGITLKVEGELNRTPFERSQKVARLYAATQKLAEALDLPMDETSRGGCSDGNIAAGLGVPVLDGLGCSGAGAHALHEHILASTIAPRAVLIHNMLMSRTFQAMALDA
jgi:glutamate carboxypeptidase